MTPAQMRVLFRERYNLSSNVNDDKEDDEMYLYLNSAVNDKIIRTINTGDWFYIEKELRTLITKSGEIIPVSDTEANPIDEISNGKHYSIPSDFMFFIKAFYELNITEGNPPEVNTYWHSAERISIEESYHFIETRNNKPYIRQAKVIFDSYIDTDTDPDDFFTTYIILVDPDDYDNLVNSKLQYIKKPATIASGVNCDLPDHVHEEIVEMAVNLAIEGSENMERFQTHTAIVNPQTRQQ
jgi:hypothetical protein